MADTKAIDIRAFDVRGLTLVTDTLVICSAASEPQMKAVFSKVKRGMTEIGVKPSHVEGDASGGWGLLDYGDIVVHIFRVESREFYDLDGLWGDAPAVDLDLDD
ncbi:MAG: ribosome silencing factor [bacterium]|nr:ribosome silencing factor [bacterium]